MVEIKILSEVGKFRGEIVDYELKEFDSGAVVVKLHINVSEILDEGAWFAHDGASFVGDVWVVGKKGLQKMACENLINYAGWSGSFASIVERTWHPTPVAFETEMNEKYGLQLKYLNPYESGGGSTEGISSDSAKSLDSRLGGQLRSLAGNSAMQNTPVPASKMTNQTVADENIPF